MMKHARFDELLVAFGILAFVAAFLVVPSSSEAGVIYQATMTGAQEVPGPGDPDGLATGRISLDDVTGEISWKFLYSNIAAPTAMHIHGPGGSAGSAAGVFIGLGVATSGGPGTLFDSLIAAPAQVAAIVSDPTDFYVNIHNAAFPGGAVRGQLGNVVPEPASLVMFGVGLLGVVGYSWRRRK
jgi:hypothetical protein